MADGKRASTGPKITVATPNIGGPSSTVPLEAALAGCIGARIRLTTVLQPTLEGNLFTVDPLTNLVVIGTNFPSSGASSTMQLTLPGDYHVIPISKVQSFQLLALARDSTGESGIQDLGQGIRKVDAASLKARERSAVERELRKEGSRGQGIGKEAQDIFDALGRTLPVRWHEKSIIVLDSITIRPPYGPDECKAPAKDAAAVQRVKKVLEMEKRKVADRNMSSTNSTTSIKSMPASVGANTSGSGSATSSAPPPALPSILPSTPIVAAIPVLATGMRKGG